MDTRHPIARFSHSLIDALGKVATASPTFMSTSEKAEVLLEFAQAREQLAALELSVMAVSGDVAEKHAHRSVADFIASNTHADRPALAAAERLAHDLDDRWHLVAEAFAAGSVSLDKARVIVNVLSRLAVDETVSADVLERAEAHLVAQAPRFTARELRTLARRVLDVVAPEIGEAAEARTLEAEERRALEEMSLSFYPRPDGIDGITEIRGRIPDHAAARLKTYLHAFAAPRRIAPVADEAGGRVETTRPSHSRRLAQAFCSFIETTDPERLPIHGGSATTLMVTMSLDDLRRGLAAVGIGEGSDDAVRISASQARRLACTASIIPAVLGGKSEPLDLGRSSRLFSAAQRRAMALRDKTCRAKGCTVPADWTEAHHFREPWSQGGRTDLADGKLLCSWHHHRAHDDRYLHSELPNGDVRFYRRR